MIRYAAQVTPYVWLMPNIQHPIDVLLRQPNFAGQMHRKTNNLVGKWDLKGQARDLGRDLSTALATISGAITAPRGDAGPGQSNWAFQGGPTQEAARAPQV